MSKSQADSAFGNLFNAAFDGYVKPVAADTPTVHQIALYKLQMLNPLVRFDGFAKALRSACFEDVEEAEVGIDKLSTGFVPDAWVIDTASRIVIIYEVEDTNKLSSRKIDEICSLAWELWEGMWFLQLICLDRYGNPIFNVDAFSWARQIDAQRFQNAKIRHEREKAKKRQRMHEKAPRKKEEIRHPLVKTTWPEITCERPTKT